jgi:hypothetical protein
LGLADTEWLMDGLTSEEQAELRRLRRENRQLKLEREIPGAGDPKKSRGLICSGHEEAVPDGDSRS